MMGKFKGNCPELEGFIFDCSDYQQVDKYVMTIKQIVEYVGVEYKQGGDICSMIENEQLFIVPTPAQSGNNLPTKWDQIIFKSEVESYAKCKSMLHENMQKAYSLILGQCTEMLKVKLKHAVTWELTSMAMDVLSLMSLIKAIIFKFKDQKYLPLALHMAKKNFYSFCQGNMSNQDYLEKFKNLVDIASGIQWTLVGYSNS